MTTYTHEYLFAAMQKYRIYPTPFGNDAWAINFYEADVTDEQEIALNTPGWIPDGLFPTPEAAIDAAVKIIESVNTLKAKISSAALANHAISTL